MRSTHDGSFCVPNENRSPFAHRIVSSSLKDRIQADLNTARKDRNKLRTLVLSTLLSDIKNKEIDERSDVYGLGALLYYLLTGAAPHAGNTALERVLAAERGAPLPPSAWRPELPERLFDYTPSEHPFSV